jgi:hypothetical protein
MTQMGGPVNFDKIELNPKVDASVFQMPKEEEVPSTEKKE